MSLEKASIVVGLNCGSSLEQMKEKGINTVKEYNQKTGKMIDDLYDGWEEQKDIAKQFVKAPPESNLKLLESRNKIHKNAVEFSKKTLKEEVSRTFAGNTYLGEDFNRSAMSFITGLAKDENEIEEISEAIKSKNTEKLGEFFRQGIERCKNVLNNSMYDCTDEERLNDITNNYKVYKVLALMESNHITEIVATLGIGDNVKKEVDDWNKNYAGIAVTASMQRNYINFYSSPLYPDMGLDKMFKYIPENSVLADDEEFDEYVSQYKDDKNTLKVIMAEVTAFKSPKRFDKDMALEQAGDDFNKIYRFFENKDKKVKSNQLLDEKGKIINEDQFTKYMLSGKKVFVYDDEGNYLSSMKADFNRMGAIQYDSKTIVVEKEEDFSIGMKDLKDLMGKSNPKRLEDPKKEYTQILNELNDLSSKNFSKEDRDAKIKNIMDLSAKYMTEHKKTKGITGIGDKRRNAIETVYNSCKKLSNELDKSEDKNTEKKQENVETRKSIIVDGAKTPEQKLQEEKLQESVQKSVNITAKIQGKATSMEQKFAEMMKQNANKFKNGKVKTSNEMGMKTK